MARKYMRAVVSNNRYKVNGHVVEGFEITILGRCTTSGAQKDAKGKALPKKHLTHSLVRWSDKKTYKLLGLPEANFVVSDWSLERFFEVQDS